MENIKQLLEEITNLNRRQLKVFIIEILYYVKKREIDTENIEEILKKAKTY